MINESETYFKLYSCCIPVKGARRSIICDLQRNNDYQFIPNGLFEILKLHSRKTIKEIKIVYGHDNEKVIDEYFSFLIEKEFGFWCNKVELDLFPEMDITWDKPSVITNAIIDNNSNSKHNYRNIFSQLSELNCQSVQLRFFEETNLEMLSEIISEANDLRINSFQIVCKLPNKIAEKDIKQFCRNNPFVLLLFIHSSIKEKVIDTGYKEQYVAYSKQKIDTSAHCGFIHPNYFSVNTSLFTEAQQHNTCLNRKISVDVNGDIKNCPAMNTSFGNTTKNKLSEVVIKSKFQKIWEINKDQIEVCKDCEFRYICTDCRAFTTDPENIYSKPLKCSYNPYTATWL